MPGSKGFPTWYAEIPAFPAVTVPASGNTVIATIDTSAYDRICVEISNITQALDAFIIAALFHSTGSYNTLYSAAGSFTSPAGLIIGASGDLTALAASAVGWFIMDVKGIGSIRLSASAAVNSAVATVRAAGV